jgi:predicted dehydrogenase
MSLKKEEPLKRELDDFLAAVRSGRNLQACGWDAVANLRVCEAASRSLKERKRITVPQER